VQTRSGAACLVLNALQSRAAKIGFSRDKVITLLFTPVLFKGLPRSPNGGDAMMYENYGTF
jgi:hypothetical protein